MLKPVSPYISDTIAHVFYYAQHMATVHYENGKLHVHKEVIAQAKEEAAAKDQSIERKDTSIADHILSAEKEVFYYTEILIVQPALLTILPEQFLQADYPPPKYKAFHS